MLQTKISFNTKIKSTLKYLIVAALFIGILIFYLNVDKKPLRSNDNSSFEKAVVTEILEDNLQEDGTNAGSQKVILCINSGEYKGKTYEATSICGYLYGAQCKVGTKVIAQISSYEDNLTVNVYSYDRGNAIYILIGIFLLSMWLIGGKKGINSIIALIFTFVVVIMLFIPLLYIGVTPFLAAVITTVMITVITMILIGGVSIKSLCAILGTTFGVIVAGLAAAIFGNVGNISGYNTEDIETMLYIGQNSNLKIGGLLFAGILIASLGAVMDVGMSVSSTIIEIYSHKQELTVKELFKSGINVGRDMIGTMSNTLILAFTGTSINTVLVIYAYSMPYLQMINMYSIGIEIMRGIAGTLGVICTVPFTSVVTAVIVGKKNR